MTFKNEKLKYCCTLRGRIGWQNLRSDEFTDEGPYLITGMHFTDGRVDWKRCFHISEERYALDSNIHVHPGDLLITKDGSIGKLAYIGSIPGPACLNSHLLLIRPRKSQPSTRYLFYLLQSDQFQRFVLEEQSGTTFYGISQESIENFNAPLPCSLDDQIAIAQFLDCETSKIDDLIAKKQRLIELLDEKRSALISRAVTQGLDPSVPMKDSGIQWLGRVPADWSIVRLKYLSRRIVDGTHHTPEYIDSGIPFLTVRNLTGSEGIDLTECNYISERDHSEFCKRAKPEIGDLLITKDGTLGTVRIIEQEPHFSIFVSVALIKLLPSLSPLYAKMCLESDCVRSQFGSRRLGSALQHLHLEEIGDVTVALPSLSTQKEIEKEMSRAVEKEWRLTHTVLAQIDLLREYRSALITAAVTGQLDVREHEEKLEALA